MEGLVKGLEGVALDDAVEGAESRRDRRAGAAPVDWDREGPARSTWAEVLVTCSILRLRAGM